VMARQLGLESVQLEKSRFSLHFPPSVQVSPTDVQRLVEKSSSQLEFNVGKSLSIETFLRASDEQERLQKARDLVEELL
jgi:transcription-repair coupling factor (superfamily II helicase)